MNTPSIGPARRGPRPKSDRGAQTGYRMTARQRAQLTIAQAYTGASSLQAVIDEAVEHYIEWMNTNADGFKEAADNAIRFQEKKAGITRLDTGSPADQEDSTPS